MTYHQKKELYKQGLYSCDTPKADTTKWGIAEWVYYIDSHGSWL